MSSLIAAKTTFPLFVISYRGKRRPESGDEVGGHLSEKFVELIVRTDPGPGNRVTTAFTDRAVLCTDADRPDLLVPT